MALPKPGQIKSMGTQEFSLILGLTETEARILLEITQYGPDEFCEVFKKKLGSGLDKNRAQVKQLFETLKKELPPHLRKFDRARKIFSDPE